MKKLMLIIAVSMVSVLHAKTFKTAVEYNDFLVGEQKAVIEKIGEVSTALTSDHFNAKQVWNAQKALIKQCDKSIKKVENTNAYANSIDFKKSSIDLLNCYKEFGENGFVEIINIYCKANTTQDDVDRIDEILEMFGLMEDLNIILFEYAQTNFANDNNFTVAKN